jgi:hypothetical protein
MSGLSMDAASVGGALDYARHIPTACAHSVPRLSVRATHGSLRSSVNGCTALAVERRHAHNNSTLDRP